MITSLLILAVWLLFAIAIGEAARSRGRPGVGRFFVAILISPLLAALLLFILPVRVVYRDLRKCPYCAELVKREAKICKHCHSELPPMIIKVQSAEERAARLARLKRQARQAVFGAVSVLAIVGLFATFAVMAARAEEQTRIYAPNGQSVGTAVPLGQGSVRYYDSRGNSLGTSTTNSTGTTTFYGPRGNVTGTAVAPTRRK